MCGTFSLATWFAEGRWAALEGLVLLGSGAVFWVIWGVFDGILGVFDGILGLF
jgi:hypothetical protein